MFRQITFIKVKADAPPEKVDEVEKAIRDLGTIVPEVRRPHVMRINNDPICDVLFVWEFENREAHQRYQRHPFHGPMDERIRPYFESIYSVRYDFEPEK